MLIINESFRLRRPEPKDVEAMYGYRNDPEIIDALGGFSRGYSRKDLLDWVERQQKSTADIVWVIADREDNCVGHYGLYRIDWRTGTAEAGICIGPSALRYMGLGKQIFSMVTTYAFQQLNLRKIQNIVLGTNKVSINFNKKFGLKEECVLRKEEFRNGKYEDLHVFGMFRRDWNPDAAKCRAV
jgi:RimJ/RimL family protein N-acetyltransferase